MKPSLGSEYLWSSTAVSATALDINKNLERTNPTNEMLITLRPDLGMKEEEVAAAAVEKEERERGRDGAGFLEEEIELRF